MYERLLNKNEPQTMESFYDDLCAYTQKVIDGKSPCGDGGWIRYRITEPIHFEDIKILLNLKF